MPSNHILINNSLEYIVNDSQMDNLIHWLDENGYTANTGIRKEPDEIITSAMASSILIES